MDWHGRCNWFPGQSEAAFVEETEKKKEVLVGSEKYAEKEKQGSLEGDGSI